MLKAFLRDSTIYGLLRVLTSGVSLLLLPLYTRVLSPGEYGVVDLVAVLATFITTIFTVEISQGLARSYAAVKSDEERSLYASTAFWFAAGSLLGFLLLTVPFASSAAQWVAGGAGHTNAMRLAACAIATQALLTIVLTQLRYALRPWSYAAGSLAFSGTSLAAAFVYVRVLGLGVRGVFLGQLTAGVLALAVALRLAHGEIGFRFDRMKCRELLAFSAPLVFSSLGVFASVYADRFAIRSFLTIEALGVYAVGARLASVVSLAMAAFQMSLSPLVYSHYADPDAPRQFERIFRWFIAGSSLLLFLVGVFAADILRFVTSSAYAGAVQVVFLLALAAVLANLYMFAPGLWIARRTGLIATINVSVAAVSLACNAVVVRMAGIRGVALVACSVALLGFIVQVSLAQRAYKVPYRWGRVAAAAAVTLVFAVVAAPLGGVRADAALFAAKAAVFLFFGGLVVVLVLGRDELRLLADTVRRIVNPRNRPGAGMAT
jgi:O-antigen/teichoic acid export membrane protein